MQAQALICDAQQNFSLQPVNLPDPAPDQVAIRTLWSGVSIGTEFALIRNKISWGPYPLCTGYMGVGEILEAGADITDLRPGDQVYFRGNASIALTDGSPVTPVSGAHCSHIVTKAGGTHGVAPMVAGAPPEAAAMFAMPAVGLNGVDMANPRAGDTVVVHGAGLIGLGVVAACAHRGCRVVAIDINDTQLALAISMGADVAVNSRSTVMSEALRAIAPDGADVVFECTGIPSCIDPAIALCRREGAFVWQGNYGAEAISMHFLPPHALRLRMFFPCDDGGPACRRAVVKNMASGALRWDRCITHRISSSEAPDMFQRINDGTDKSIVGVVIQWNA